MARKLAAGIGGLISLEEATNRPPVVSADLDLPRVHMDGHDRRRFLVPRFEIAGLERLDIPVADILALAAEALGHALDVLRAYGQFGQAR